MSFDDYCEYYNILSNANYVKQSNTKLKQQFVFLRTNVTYSNWF